MHKDAPGTQVLKVVLWHVHVDFKPHSCQSKCNKCPHMHSATRNAMPPNSTPRHTTARYATKCSAMQLSGAQNSAAQTSAAQRNATDITQRNAFPYSSGCKQRPGAKMAHTHTHTLTLTLTPTPAHTHGHSAHACAQARTCTRTRTRTHTHTHIYTHIYTHTQTHTNTHTHTHTNTHQAPWTRTALPSYQRLSAIPERCQKSRPSTELPQRSTQTSQKRGQEADIATLNMIDDWCPCVRVGYMQEVQCSWHSVIPTMAMRALEQQTTTPSAKKPELMSTWTSGANCLLAGSPFCGGGCWSLVGGRLEAHVTVGSLCSRNLGMISPSTITPGLCPGMPT